MKYSRFSLLRLYWFKFKDRGIVLPIAIGLGLIAVLVGIIMLSRSFRDQTYVVINQSAVGSQALAELGVTRYRDLINTFRVIAVASACGSSWNTSGNCTNTTTASWNATAGKPPTPTERRTMQLGNNSFLPNLINEVANPTKTFPPKTMLKTIEAANIPVCPTTPVTTVQNQTNQSWQNSSSSNPQDGQFRLINYTYDPNPSKTTPDPQKANDNIGTLTVEGRVGQAGSGSTATETTGTGTTRVQVTFPVINQPPWGLWIQVTKDDPTSEKPQDLSVPPSGRVNAEIRDSSCANSTTPGLAIATLVNALRGIQSDNRNYISTPQKFFPKSPKPTIAPSSNALILSSGVITLSKSSYTYKQTVMANPDPINGKSRNLIAASMVISGTGKLLVDAPGKTVQIYLLGDLVLQDQASIEVTKGTRLIMYIQGVNIFMQGTSSTQKVSLINAPENAPDGFQIYPLGSSTDKTAALIAVIKDTDMTNVFIFGPKAVIQQQGSSTITGTMWLWTWQGTDSATFIQGNKPPDFTQLAIVTSPNTPAAPTLENISINTIGNISSWQRCQAATTVDCQP